MPCLVLGQSREEVLPGPAWLVSQAAGWNVSHWMRAGSSHPGRQAAIGGRVGRGALRKWSAAGRLAVCRWSEVLYRCYYAVQRPRLLPGRTPARCLGAMTSCPSAGRRDECCSPARDEMRCGCAWTSSRGRTRLTPYVPSRPAGRTMHRRRAGQTK